MKNKKSAEACTHCHACQEQCEFLKNMVLISEIQSSWKNWHIIVSSVGNVQKYVPRGLMEERISWNCGENR